MGEKSRKKSFAALEPKVDLPSSSENGGSRSVQMWMHLSSSKACCRASKLYCTVRISSKLNFQV